MLVGGSRREGGGEGAGEKEEGRDQEGITFYKEASLEYFYYVTLFSLFSFLKLLHCSGGIL